MPISYCVTCYKRLFHLRSTLPVNIKRKHFDDEIVVLDYGDTEELAEWIVSMEPLIRSGHLVYARTEAASWHMAHAKNVAHQLASKEIVCNLDADNFISEGMSAWLNRKFELYSEIIAYPDRS